MTRFNLFLSIRVRFYLRKNEKKIKTVRSLSLTGVKLKKKKRVWSLIFFIQFELDFKSKKSIIQIKRKSFIFKNTHTFFFLLIPYILKLIFSGNARINPIPNEVIFPQVCLSVSCSFLFILFSSTLTSHAICGLPWCITPSVHPHL